MLRRMSRSTPAGATERTDDALHCADALYGVLSSLLRRLPRDLSLTSMSALSTLERLGPRRVTDLAVSEGVAQPSITSLVTALERAGLVERRGDPADRRVVLVAITAAGSEYLNARRLKHLASFAQLIDELPPAEVGALAAAIPALQHLRDLDEHRRNPRP